MDSYSNSSRALKEVYLSLFVLFFRIGANQWPPSWNVNPEKATAAMTMVQVILAGTLNFWVDIIVGHRVEVSEILSVPLVIAVYLVNRYFLVTKGYGTRFERQFDSIPRHKRLALGFGSIGILVAIVGIFYLLGTAHERAFPPLSGGGL